MASRKMQGSQMLETTVEYLDAIDVLIVDDDISFQRMAQESLNQSGFKVETVGSPSEAMRAVTRHTFDVVVTDLVLDSSATVESSVDLIEQLKRHSPATLSSSPGMPLPSRINSPISASRCWRKGSTPPRSSNI
jgi:CheY-like chemotaxis protein